MIAYASYTSNKRNVAALAARDWRLMVAPASHTVNHATISRFRYALDNGAWPAHVKGEPFDEAAFLRAVEALGARADFIVVPDIVAGGLRSLDFSLGWIERLRGACPLLMLAVQDGMEQPDVREHVGREVGVFLGGSTAWKLRTMKAWGDFAAFEGASYHVGRVNTIRRIALCAAAGATSFDGSSASRYAVTLPKLELARRQRDLFAP